MQTVKVTDNTEKRSWKTTKPLLQPGLFTQIRLTADFNLHLSFLFMSSLSSATGPAHFSSGLEVFLPFQFFHKDIEKLLKEGLRSQDNITNMEQIKTKQEHYLMMHC